MFTELELREKPVFFISSAKRSFVSFVCVLRVLSGLLFAFRVNALQPRFNAGAGIKVIAQGVADEIECQHGQHDGGSGEEDNMGRVEQMRASVVQHRAPTGDGWRNSQSQKTHG